MRTTVELPDDLLRAVEARAAQQGRALEDVVVDGLELLLKTPGDASAPTKVRGAALIEEFAGIAELPPGKTADEARKEYYKRKYGV